MPFEKDIFAFARSRVDNKGIGSRIKNSARFHSLRSALSSKGSLGSKGLSVLAMGVRSAFKLIPIPIVGDLLGQAQKGLAGYARGKHLSKRKGEAAKAKNVEDQMKFGIKELSVESLDRYRWKAQDALVEMNKKVVAYQASFVDKASKAKPCHAMLELAEAVAQAERRMEKLAKACNEITDVLGPVAAWANDHTTKLVAAKSSYSTQFAAHIANELRKADNLNTAMSGQGEYAMMAQHEHCEHYCFYNMSNESDDWATARKNIAEAVAALTSPFEVESFISLDGSAFKEAPDGAPPAATTAAAPSTSSSTASAV
ncbi:MAG: hypothetical protein JWQ07_832 [Ramlibacter sp.]|nr:hypothetical protein [Ramlibacter sp.]